MFKNLLIIFFLIIAFESFAQKEEILIGFQVPLDDNIYTSKTEVANIYYLEYLYYVKKDSSNDFYEKQFIKFDPADTSYTEHNYLRSSNTRYFPVVYVSYEQATNYCKWLESILIQRMVENPDIDQDKFLLKVRLPSIEEWIKMAIRYDYYLENTKWPNKFSSLPFKKSELKNLIKTYDLDISKREYYNKLREFMETNPIYMIENLRYDGNKDYFNYAININHTWPREKNDEFMNIPYDLRGNVSEMTTTKGIAKGGNWQSTPNEIGIMDNIKYFKPANNIGFRCVCEFTER